MAQSNGPLNGMTIRTMVMVFLALLLPLIGWAFATINGDVKDAVAEIRELRISATDMREDVVGWRALHLDKTHPRTEGEIKAVQVALRSVQEQADTHQDEVVTLLKELKRD